MPGWWSANDFRHARVALVGASVASWTVLLADEAGALALPAAGCLHLGLVASLVLERQWWPVRLPAAVLLLPTSIMAAALAAFTFGSGGSAEWGPTLATTSLAFGISHVVQFWRLAGLPIPPLHPLVAPDSGERCSVPGG
jgi:hypothetical protein